MTDHIARRQTNAVPSPGQITRCCVGYCATQCGYVSFIPLTEQSANKARQNIAHTPRGHPGITGRADIYATALVVRRNNTARPL